ncbi:endonuclease/exonuclease/phosphatase (EEP) superfamily protein YafD [Haloferula luteola]|uniref:Endonuclease/exonuclease/phosphatase (EEP) superfamily protein YafD n=1 Tax=Haloferula luteola TaxID=595692 RepID=A0A840V190_9BACT|nr:endonuclease/exonuclease/phosphatase family protein [Haloferula luteola]MBB5351755.1 endonuclease/exonuclease/phosphatase (EEP) superfamily protein YafD [Haloferula luteola]
MRPSTRFTRRLGWLLIGGSLALHFVTVFAYYRQPSLLAAFTVMPIWVWGGLGLFASCLAFLALRAPLSLVVTTVWAFTLLLGADEARVIGHFHARPPQPGPPLAYHGTQPIRVITLNAAHFLYGDPTADLRGWQPDIVLLQEISPAHAQKIADALFGKEAHFRAYSRNAVASRWPIVREVRNPNIRFRFFNHNVTIRLPNGRTVEVSNLHLTSAATDLSLWRPTCWKNHRENRRARHFEISVALRILEETCGFPGAQPVILAGDFNAPPTDPIHRLLSQDFLDAFDEAGTGWGNTFQRRIPILRIDQIHATRHFKPLGCRAVTTRHSDHRFVVADLLLES